ncbi:MAG: hypothetical protein WBL40_16715, partial [Terrimicrobiaceae bacterium]
MLPNPDISCAIDTWPFGMLPRWVIQDTIVHLCASSSRTTEEFMPAPAMIKPHMEVLGSDGAH